MYPIIVIVAAAAIIFGGCVSIDQCPSQRVWMIDPYMNSLGIIAPLFIDPGDLSNSTKFHTDSKFAEILGITVEELIQQYEKAKEEAASPNIKGTI